MQQKIVIAVDFDDVTFDLNEPFAQWHNEKYGTSIRYEDIIDYDLTKIYKADLETLIHRLDIFRTQHHHNMPLTPGVSESLALLKEIGSLHNITARCESLKSVTEMMLDLHLPNVFTALHLTNGFSSKNKGKQRSKIDFCRDINAKVLIDDNPNQTEEFAVSEITLLVPDRPWNQKLFPDGVIRCGSWREPETCWQEIVSWIYSNF